MTGTRDGGELRTGTGESSCHRRDEESHDRDGCSHDMDRLFHDKNGDPMTRPEDSQTGTGNTISDARECVSGTGNPMTRIDDTMP